jgi:hypothetical protein
MASSSSLVGGDHDDIDISSGDHKSEYGAMAQVGSSESTAADDDVLRFGWRYGLGYYRRAHVDEHLITLS